MTHRTAIALSAVLLLACSCAPRSSRRADTNDTEHALDTVALARSVEEMLPRIRQHVETMASFGPRQTGQVGCEKTLAYVREQLGESAERLGVELIPLETTVTVSLDRTHPEQIPLAGPDVSHVVIEGLEEGPIRWPAYSLQANCIQACATLPADSPDAADREDSDTIERPRRLVDLGAGTWEDFRGKTFDDAVVLLDFNSSEAWLRAAGLGAYGAIFIEPEQTNVFQADRKYLATLPLNVPRLYLRREEGLRLRKALAGGKDVQVTLANRLRFRNVSARGWELTIPGRNRDACHVLATHLDARSIVPDLAWGGAELWGPAEMLELVRYFSRNQPACDLRFLFVTGHWQSQRLMREYVCYGRDAFSRIGPYFKMAMSVDLDPEGKSVNLLNENQWNISVGPLFSWLRHRLFQEGGWRDQVLDGFDLRERGINVYAGRRPFLAETRDSVLASRNDRSPLVFAPQYPTAEEPWRGLSMPGFTFQTSRLARLHHNTPLDRIPDLDDDRIDNRLRPQLQITLALLEQLLGYPPRQIPTPRPVLRERPTWGGYAQVTGQVQLWDRSIGWFSQRLPTETLETPDGQATEQPMQTFIHAYPVDEFFRNRITPRLRNYLHWPLNPSRAQHRMLQSFMFQDLLLLENEYFDIKTVYAGFAETQYNAIGYAINSGGQIQYATDFGTHGDSNKSFQCTDVDLDTWTPDIPVSLFECGTVELFDLVDPQRYNPSTLVRDSWLQEYIIHGAHADYGVAPHLRIEGIKDIQSHTDIERWGYTQYGPTAMVFLPATYSRRTQRMAYSSAAEIILGRWHTNFAVLNNPDEQGIPQGYRLGPGESLRLASSEKPTPLVCVEQLIQLNQDRVREFAKHDVASPLAQRYHEESLEALELGQDAHEKRDWETALAEYMRAWIAESLAYRNTVSLLLDVVSTTVLYFVLLLPFSFLVERLLIPQRTVLRSAIVSVLVFAAFAAVLYMFHPGFKLAHNVVVTVTAFVIVVMTIPALILLLVRGVAMLRAIGSKAVITQQSEAESAGVVMASLSLAISNMRRRKLRTALTLVTITSLVVALVMLTTSSAFDFRILEPTGTTGASFQGLQIFNATDRRQPLLHETAYLYEAALADEALVLRREGVNYGYDHKIDTGAMLLTHDGRSVPLPYFQVMTPKDNELQYRYSRSQTDSAGTADATVTVGVRIADFFRDRIRRKTLPAPGNATPGGTVVDLALGGRGRFLREGDVDVCCLPNNMAEALGVDVGDTVEIMGLPLEVIGIWQARSTQTREVVQRRTAARPGDPSVPLYVLLFAGMVPVALLLHLVVAGQAGLFRRAVTTLAIYGVAVGMGSLLIESSTTHAEEPRTEEIVEEQTVILPGPMDQLTDLDGLPITTMRGSMARQGEPDNPMHAPTREVVIVPRAWIRQHDIFPPVVHSLVVVPRDEEGKVQTERIPELAERLAREILNVDIFSHYILPDGQELSQRISMHTATHVKGSSMMFVVLAAAVLMILAIMTGTVYERMREIHIFSSVGLSPKHVAGMFLIEALVFAGIASVLGYFMGILLLKGLLAYLKATGQQQEFYPNYLGVFVLYSIGLAVLATVASSLYPIRLASKIVNPSGGKTWKLDDQSAGNVWDIHMPFIATTWNEARAMMAYAYEFLAMHQGERSGRFVCERPPSGRCVDSTLELYMPVWLAPFERNVSQDARLAIQPSPDAEWWVMTLRLERISGPPYLWRRGATVFVNRLCRHLLRWQAAGSEQEQQYANLAGEVFPGSDRAPDTVES